MSKTYLQNGLVYQDRTFVSKTLLLEDGKVFVLEPQADVADGAVVNAEGLRIVPGFLDTHTHGAVGVDVNGATAEDLEKISRFLAQKGTTTWQASVLTDTQEQTEWCISQMRRWETLEHQGAELAGIHLEGPFLAPAYKGAMPEHLLQQNNLPLIAHYQELAGGKIRYLTLSPELPGAVEMIPALKELGIVVGIGHSGATYQQAMQAIDAGATVGTHVGNAMRLLHQHEPAIFGAVLESDCYCEVIADGRHLHPGTVRILVKAKGADRIVAISDSIMAAGLPDGYYHLGVNQVVVEQGDAKLVSDGTRAGSTLTQDVALQNLLAYTGLPLEQVVPMLSENPAREMGLFQRKGSIADGKDADLVCLDAENRIVHVFARGRQVL